MSHFLPLYCPLPKIWHFSFVLCCSTQENTLVMLKEMFLNWIMDVFSHPDAFAFLRYHADLRLLMSSSLMCRLHLETQRREFDCNSFRTLFKSVLQISEERTGLSLLSGPNRPAAQKTKQFPITKAEWGSNLSPAQGGGFWGGLKISCLLQRLRFNLLQQRSCGGADLNRAGLHEDFLQMKLQTHREKKRSDFCSNSGCKSQLLLEEAEQPSWIDFSSTSENI